ncbi:MAG: fibrobacter succinogenes major paralogous domain-containing protein [Chitinispirillales bacterium]|jgi:uncharacterized protein (TIGR02145 family)|nr:fibrobacter succinogenes major paralogous domain-containing protein [Chitinispirillales bacterium]
MIKSIFVRLAFGVVIICAALFAGCGDNGVNNGMGGGGLQFNPYISYGSLVDSRDGQSYRTVRIGDRIWMAENLNYETSNSWCYGNSDFYCATYGRLYYGYAALGACPLGWRLPSDVDWDDLVLAAGGFEVAGERLKSQIGWNDSGNGTDEFGFSALPGGYGRSCRRAFIGAGWAGFWWSATKLGVWIMGFDYNGMEINYIGEHAGLSVRCVQDRRH